MSVRTGWAKAVVAVTAREIGVDSDMMVLVAAIRSKKQETESESNCLMTLPIQKVEGKGGAWIQEIQYRIKLLISSIDYRAKSVWKSAFDTIMRLN